MTHLLQNSIGGNSKTLMIMHLNPRAAFANESLNTLRFAHKVNNTNIGTAQKVIFKKFKLEISISFLTDLERYFLGCEVVITAKEEFHFENINLYIYCHHFSHSIYVTNHKE